jgi:hypothetical protein
VGNFDDMHSALTPPWRFTSSSQLACWPPRARGAAMNLLVMPRIARLPGTSLSWAPASMPCSMSWASDLAHPLNPWCSHGNTRGSAVRRRLFDWFGLGLAGRGMRLAGARGTVDHGMTAGPGAGAREHGPDGADQPGGSVSRRLLPAGPGACDPGWTKVVLTPAA